MCALFCILILKNAQCAAIKTDALIQLMKKTFNLLFSSIYFPSATTHWRILFFH